ncbi:MAG: hypothetical protein DMG94_10105 [Acidobacteria bacterium]|nr:MAG: hypothetical protein DMG94_10105 [Acidobacteriota bacterium]
MTRFKESNYWPGTASMPTGTPGELPSRVDVGIIGAGFTGLSAARTLAKAGATVAVLEANSIGWGASSRNGGMVLSGVRLDPATLANRYGIEATRRMYSASLGSLASSRTSTPMHGPRKSSRRSSIISLGLCDAVNCQKK